MNKLQTIEVAIADMDCMECTRHVQAEIATLPGVAAVSVSLAAEKAVVQLEPDRVDIEMIRQAVEKAGYKIAVPRGAKNEETVVRRNHRPLAEISRRVTRLLALLFGAVLTIVVVGEWLGVFARLTARVPFAIGVGIVVLAGWSIFRDVLRATLRRQVTSHTLMVLGMLAALVVGEWPTAAVVVFFMRVGDYTEKFTAAGARRAVKNLTALAPQTAHVLRDAQELEIAITEVKVGDIVVVRPGGKIPVDGAVIAGSATVDQASITGESMPVEIVPGARVFAATIAQSGSLRIRTEQVGADTTFGHVIKLVEEAENHRAEVQRFADRFTRYFLPIVAGVAAATFFSSRDPMATTAVLVVACSCSIALATPIAMLAAIGASARRGLLIKGGKYLEALARTDVLLIDKTGTLTAGKPQLTEIRTLNGVDESELLTWVAAAERYSEHPLAEAVRSTARARNLPVVEAADFVAIPGQGVHAVIDGKRIAVGNRQLIPEAAALPDASELAKAGKTLLFVRQNEQLVGVLAAEDTLRPEVPAALAAVRDLGVHHIELLTGDNERVAAALAAKLGIRYQANLLPEDKIAVVKALQQAGNTVIMVGDGINDAPALAQANIGIAMGAAGADIALEAAHVALMREDWMLVPEVLRLARRAMGVVKANLLFTAVYNLCGLSLAAFGLLPPILAAAAQSLPDLGILANSSRLLRQR